MRINKKSTNQKGFTIIELLVATSVLAVILLIVTGMLVNIGNLFFKDVNQSKAQDTVRSISDEISNQLQLTANQPQIGSQVIAGVTIDTYCIGATRYSYVLNTQMGNGSGQIPHVLWRDTPTTGCDPTKAANLTTVPPGLPSTGSNGADLVSANSVLTELCMGTFNAGNCAPSSVPVSPYTLAVGVGYAPDTASIGTVSGPNILLNLAGINSSCSVKVGDQFCSTASLVTTVANRL